LRALESDPAGQAPVIDAGVRSLIVTYPDESAFTAMTKMLVNNVGRLPVVERANSHKLVGYVNRATLMACWGRHLQDESLRESGWYRQLRGRGGAPESARRTVAGHVVEISTNCLQLRPDAASDEKAAAMPSEEFSLLVPVPGISLGDHVRVKFHDEDGHHVAHSVEELQTRQ
jgi:hypothetical protein